MEMRIYEGRQAVINKVEINGNTAVYENVIRRELRTKPEPSSARVTSSVQHESWPRPDSSTLKNGHPPCTAS